MSKISVFVKDYVSMAVVWRIAFHSGKKVVSTSKAVASDSVTTIYTVIRIAASFLFFDSFDEDGVVVGAVFFEFGAVVEYSSEGVHGYVGVGISGFAFVSADAAEVEVDGAVGFTLDDAVVSVVEGDVGSVH